MVTTSLEDLEPVAVITEPEPRRQRRRTSSVVGRTALYLVLSLGAIAMITPFVWMVLTSFKSLGDVSGDFSWLPPTWHPENYVLAFQAAPFLLYFRNSLIVVVCQTIPVILFCTAAGYALAKLPMRGSRALLNYFILLLVIPFQVLLVPLFLVIKSVPLAGGNDIFGQGGSGWVNTWWALIIPFVASPFLVFLARQFFVLLPSELADAARIDGASEFGIFLRIMAPLAKPAIVTIALLHIEGAWNGFIWPLVATTSQELRPLQFGLASFASTAGGGTNWPYLMAMSTLTILPMVLLFVFGQKVFIQGVSTAGIKG